MYLSFLHVARLARALTHCPLLLRLNRIAASYVAILTICGVACHFGGRQFREGWDPNFSFLRSYKTIITICIVWTLSLRVCVRAHLEAQTRSGVVLLLYMRTGSVPWAWGRDNAAQLAFSSPC